MADDTSSAGSDLLEFATELTIAWLSNPNTRASADEVPSFLKTMHDAVTGLTAPGGAVEDAASETPVYTPAVTARKSLSSPDHILSMIDGKPYKTLKRHLSTHGLTPAQYRERYKLKADYPMVAESYGAFRRDMAKKLGLGRKPAAAAKAEPVSKPAAKAQIVEAVATKAPAKETAKAKPAAAAKPASRKPRSAKTAAAPSPAPTESQA